MPTRTTATLSMANSLQEQREKASVLEVSDWY